MKENRLLQTVRKTSFLPKGLHSFVLSKIFGNIVPMVGTLGVRYEEVTPKKVVCSIQNKRRAQNHIKGVHAMAMGLLAETATGFVVGANLPDDKLPLLKTIHIDYKKRAIGAMKAVATLTDEQIRQILTEPKGDVVVACSVTDETGQEPIQTNIVWAWVSKEKKA